MKEDLLHFIWKYKKYPISELKTTSGEALTIETVGSHNKHAGPDFFNAKLKIGKQLWAGNVEIHINASDWYAHNHEKDKNYDNVILHVVWEDNLAVFREDGSEIPSLELKNYLSNELLDAYNKLFEEKQEQFINCNKDITHVSEFLWDNWLERLYFERLEQKSEVILKLLKASQNDWEKVLFILLLKNFGSKINGDLFYRVGESLDFSIIRKLYQQRLKMESLLFGLANLIQCEDIIDPYYIKLKEEYAFLKHKYKLDESLNGSPAFFKLRPFNFPTIRLSQIASLYSSKNNLFHELIESENTDFQDIFRVTATAYWDDHFTFGKISKKSAKNVSKKFIDLLIINTIVPLKFCYLKYKGLPINDSFLGILKRTAREDNNIIDKYRNLGVCVENAKDSQALLQLHSNYCAKNKCLQCAVGSQLLNLKS